MTFRLVDRPDDRPEWLREVIGIVARNLDAERTRLIARVERATDDELAAGTDDDWGVGMVAYHVLVSQRGMIGIALRLARGEQPSSTAQPRPAAGTVARAALVEAAAKAAAAVERLRTEFPPSPDFEATAPGPYFGPWNCVAWLLANDLHCQAHLDALERGTRSAL